MKKKAYKRRQQSQQRFFICKKSLSGLSFLIFVLAGLIWVNVQIVGRIQDPEFSTISKLVVTGKRRITTDDDIRQAVTAIGKESFVAFDVNKVLLEFKRLGWIDQIAIRKEWPDRLRIHFTELTPVGLWNDILFVDQQGKLFYVPEGRIDIEDFPRFFGPDDFAPDVITKYMRFQEMIKVQQEEFLVSTISVTERYSWQMILNHQFKLELGRDKLEERLLRFFDLYPDVVAPLLPDEAIISVDLRYNSGIAIDRPR